MKKQIVLFIFLGSGVSENAFAQSQAILINGGGGNAKSNYCEYYRNIASFQNHISGWDKTNLIAGGPDSTKNDMVACKDGGPYLGEWHEGYHPDALLDAEGKPILTRGIPVGGNQGSATLASVQNAFSEASQKWGTTHPNDPLLVYTTDHGSEFKGSEVLWDQTELDTTNLRKLFQTVPSTHPQLLIADQCFSGKLLDATRDAQNQPLPNVCGFAAGSADEPTFGYGMAQALSEFDKDKSSTKTFRDVYHYLETNPAVSTMPTSTSDQFLETYLSANAAPAKVSRQKEVLASCNTDALTVTFQKTLNAAFLPDLQKELSYLKANIQKAYARANVSPNISFTDVEKLDADSVKKHDAIVDHQNDLLERFDALVTMYVTQKNPDLMKTLNDKKNAVNDLETLCDKSPDDLPLKDKLKAAEDDFSKTDAIYHQIYEAAKTNQNPDFNAFTKSVHTLPETMQINGRKIEFDPATAGPPDISNIAKELSDAEVQETKAGIQKRICRLLHRDLTNFNAINQMIQSKDTKAMSNYLSLLNCEETPLHMDAK